jgi:hypothetical protein
MFDRVVFIDPASAPRKKGATLKPAARIVAAIKTAICFVAIIGDVVKKIMIY